MTTSLGILRPNDYVYCNLWGNYTRCDSSLITLSVQSAILEDAYRDLADGK